MTMNSLFSLDGRVALVTGASRGLGQAIAIALAEAGADVMCHSSRPGGALDTLAAVRASGREAWALDADLSDPSHAQELAARASALRDIDVLVNNAGTIRRAPAAVTSLDDWSHVLRTNLDSVFVLCQQIGAGMVQRGHGKVVNVASLLSFQGGITVPAYTASKHAVAGLTKALANEWGASGVNVNAIAPGYFRTDNTQALQDNSERAPQILARIPTGRWGNPADIAGAAVFLASRASDYVNGHLLVVDGGWMAR